jgi:AcrR family transcriptional regulator
MSDLEKRRQRLSSDTRTEQILAAARHEFSEKGYTATRMDDIALRNGISKGGLYAHFKSKDAVFEALMHRSLTAPDFSQLPVLQAEISPRYVAEWLVER